MKDNLKQCREHPSTMSTISFCVDGTQLLHRRHSASTSADLTLAERGSESATPNYCALDPTSASLDLVLADEIWLWRRVDNSGPGYGEWGRREGGSGGRDGGWWTVTNPRRVAHGRAAMQRCPGVRRRQRKTVVEESTNPGAAAGPSPYKVCN